MPQVYVFNKRDLKDIFPYSIMRKTLNSNKHTDFECIAMKSKGTMDSLLILQAKSLIKLPTQFKKYHMLKNIYDNSDIAIILFRSKMRWVFIFSI